MQNNKETFLSNSIPVFWRFTAYLMCCSFLQERRAAHTDCIYCKNKFKRINEMISENDKQKVK